MTLKSRLEKLEGKTTQKGLADRLAEARAKCNSHPFQFKSRTELEQILATSKNEMTLRLARAEIRLLDNAEKC